MWFRPPAVVLCLLATGCAGTDSGAPRPVADQPIAANQSETTEKVMASAEEAITLGALIERSLSDPDLRRSLELLSECRGETGMRTMKAWGDGLGVWEGRRQFHLPVKQGVEVLERLHAADFAAFAPLYGGPKQEDPREHDRPDDGSAILIVCRIRVSPGS